MTLLVLDCDDINAHELQIAVKYKPSKQAKPARIQEPESRNQNPETNDPNQCYTKFLVRVTLG